ncbi:hydroxyisourate hydrolase [Sphingobium sp. AR-3-1]|uniref:5-hydroxyisourate hydrolase n=1 Tax=Sphingobium psychrophilum TaxID=2728834 RepID=A0A7X9WU92_9SPHN|nr:hydroxyisourate hydrolase [Sphingobium psychrophilum]NML10020.1 hydroxyisourate hydrolase [Sphingobium psychrophilum]
MLKIVALAMAGLLTLTPAVACAETISTHVLDLVRGEGGAGLPVTLSRRQADGTWKMLASAMTDDNGRVRAFGDNLQAEEGLYRLSFDMSDMSKPTHSAFFPEITIVFRVADPTRHVHVPIVLSPYGYSTYRGN